MFIMLQILCHENKEPSLGSVAVNAEGMIEPSLPAVEFTLVTLTMTRLLLESMGYRSTDRGLG